jgi:hypothetical protein
MSNVAVQVIEKLGGAKAVSELLKCDVSRVHRWTYPKEKGGTGGHIPQKRQRQLLEKAPDKVSPADFFDIKCAPPGDA